MKRQRRPLFMVFNGPFHVVQKCNNKLAIREGNVQHQVLHSLQNKMDGYCVIFQSTRLHFLTRLTKLKHEKSAN